MRSVQEQLHICRKNLFAAQEIFDSDYTENKSGRMEIINYEKNRYIEKGYISINGIVNVSSIIHRLRLRRKL